MERGKEPGAAGSEDQDIGVVPVDIGSHGHAQIACKKNVPETKSESPTAAAAIDFCALLQGRNSSCQQAQTAEEVD